MQKCEYGVAVYFACYNVWLGPYFFSSEKELKHLMLKQVGLMIVCANLEKKKNRSKRHVPESYVS